MRAILSKLNRTPGVMGSMIVNRDGVVVASELADELDENGLGAVSSSVLAALEGALTRLNMGKLSRFVISGSESKLALVDAGPAMLLVVLKRDVNLGLVNVELKTAAVDLAQKAKF
jgi:hypothetical protein